MKNVTKLKSGGLMIECQRRQQPLNLLSLKQIHSIAISSTPHRTLNTSRGVIRYRDEDLDDLSDEEICEELAPQGVIHVKRFISKRNGQTVKLNTFLITFNFPTILSSIRMGLYNDKVSPYVPNPIRCIKCQIFGHGKGQCNGKLKCFKCSEEDHEGFSCNNNPKCSNCGQPHMASSKDCQYFQKEKEIQKVKSEKNISYPEARRFVSAANDSSVQKSYASVAKRVLNSKSVETQTIFTWIENTEKPTRLTVKPKEQILTPSHKTSSFSQTASTSVETSISSTKQKNVNNKTSKSQLSKGPPQGHGKLIKDPVQVHNRYGYLDDSEEESVWNLLPDDSLSPMDESPSQTQRSPKGRSVERIPTDEKLFPHPTPKMNNIIQWNCRGLKINFIEITLLV